MARPPRRSDGRAVAGGLGRPEDCPECPRCGFGVVHEDGAVSVAVVSPELDEVSGLEILQSIHPFPESGLDEGIHRPPIPLPLVVPGLLDPKDLGCGKAVPVAQCGGQRADPDLEGHARAMDASGCIRLGERLAPPGHTTGHTVGVVPRGPDVGQRPVVRHAAEFVENPWVQGDRALGCGSLGPASRWRGESI